MKTKEQTKDLKTSISYLDYGVGIGICTGLSGLSQGSCARLLLRLLRHLHELLLQGFVRASWANMKTLTGEDSFGVVGF